MPYEDGIRTVLPDEAPSRETMTTNHDAVMTNAEHTAPREAWDAIADGYDRYVAPQEAELASEALALAHLEPEERFLDVAAGTGGLSLPAARLGAQVVATDWSPAMIERCIARARAERLANVDGRVMDAHALELDDDTFDVTGSQFGVMLVPDQAQALREMVRVTRRGGRVLLIAYGAPEELEFLDLFLSALKAVVPDFPGMPDDPPPLEFQVAEPTELRRRLEAAGLRDIEVVQTAERPAFRSGQEFWDWAYYGNPIVGQLVDDLTEEQRATIRRTVDGMLRERSDASGRAVLNNAVNIGTGVK
jgi:ubiquinone/menaquinone biosynthesis C-methylase UbiE